MPRLLATAAIAMAALVLAAVAWQRTTHYPPTRPRAAVDAAAAFSGRGPTYLADGDFPVALVLRRPMTFVTDRRKDQDFTYVLSGHDLQTLHRGSNAPTSELRPACGGTTMIVGAHRQRRRRRPSSRPGAESFARSEDTQGTTESHDDTLTVTLSPAARATVISNGRVDAGGRAR